MHIYEIGYWSMEESPMILLSSNVKYTQTEFDDLVSDAFIKSYIVKYPNIDDDYDTAGDVYREAIDILISEHGFSEIKTEISFIPFGWASIKNIDDWKGSYNDNDKLSILREKLGKYIKINNRDEKLGNILK